MSKKRAGNKTNFEVFENDLSQLDELQAQIERETGLQITLGSLARRCLREGLEQVKSRPILGIDFVFKKGDR